MNATRWFDEWSEAERAEYASRFVRLAQRGQDIDGEARFVDALADRGSRILDAGCGTGRVAAALAARGHRALGIDADASLIAAGQEQYPGLSLEHRDLRALTPDDGPFEVIVAAGNVLVYVEPGTEQAVLRALASVLAPGGTAVFGFATDRDYTIDHLDRDAAAVGWGLVHRFATWQLDPWTDDAGWAVSVFR
jgi:2-polyprenyl-3-methyl-5-hydroxy-6-metoxy-1,4-benzoquinol methylase